MKVYIELLFLINYLYDLIIMLCVSILLHRHQKLYRIFLGTTIGSISLITFFIRFNNLFLLLFKILLSTLMCFITFGKKNLFINTFYMIIITIILCGGSYLINNKYISIFLLGPIVLFLFIREEKNYRLIYKKLYDCIIIDGNNTYKLNGYLDTGNMLIDPIMNYPVFIISDEYNFSSNQIYYVPYKVVNNSSILKCVKVDKVIVNNKVIPCLLGLADKELFKNRDYIILNENIREMII